MDRSIWARSLHKDTLLGEESVPPAPQIDEDLRSIIMRAGDAAMAKVIADLKPEQGYSESDD